jgi:hypothetical protein
MNTSGSDSVSRKWNSSTSTVVIKHREALKIKELQRKKKKTDREAAEVLSKKKTSRFARMKALGLLHLQERKESDLGLRKQREREKRSLLARKQAEEREQKQRDAQREAAYENYNHLRNKTIRNSPQRWGEYNKDLTGMHRTTSHSSLPVNHSFSVTTTQSAVLSPSSFSVTQSDSSAISDSPSSSFLPPPSVKSIYPEPSNHDVGEYERVDEQQYDDISDAVSVAGSATSNHTVKSVTSVISHISLLSAPTSSQHTVQGIPVQRSSKMIDKSLKSPESQNNESSYDSFSDEHSIEHLVTTTSAMANISDTWKEDLEKHQINYMNSLPDPGIFTAELLRQKNEAKLEKKKEKQMMANIGVLPTKIVLADLISYENQTLSTCTLNQLCSTLRLNRSATLCELSLDNTGLDNKNMCLIADSLVTNQHLTALSLVKNNITSHGILSLAKALSNSEITSLRSLKLSQNKIGDRGVAALSAVLHDTVLHTIELNNIGAGDIGAKHLALALSVKRKRKNKMRPRLPTFPSLAYGENKLTPEGLLYFASCIVLNKSICSVYLDGNNSLGDQASTILSDLLQCFTSLSELSVQNIGLTRAGVSKLLTACDGSDTLRTVHLGSNKLDDLQQMSILASKFKIVHLKLEQIDASITPESHGSKNTMLPKREVERKVKSLVAPRAKPKTVAQKTHLPANVSEKVHAKDFTKDMNRLHSLIRWNKKQEEIEEMLNMKDAITIINKNDPRNGNTSLHIAAQNGHVDLVTVLILKGANINAQNHKKNTALHVRFLVSNFSFFVFSCH